MTKNKFLRELEQRLQILNEKERKDIISEYKNIIEEKVKTGQTEKEAVADFGDMEELVSEILDAYKINTDYGKNEDKVGDFVKDGETLIKKGASKLADLSKDIAEKITKNDNLSIETIFEIIIKAFLVLIAFALLKIPFFIIKQIGKELLLVIFYPLNSVLIVMWGIIVWTFYIITCVLIGIMVFKKYFNKETNDDEEIDIKKVKTSKNVKKEKKVEPVREDRTSSILKNILKIVIIIWVYIPLLFVLFGLISFASFLVYLIFKGLTLIGAILITFGLIIIFGYALQAINYLITNKKFPKIYSLIVAIPLIIIGSLLTLDKIVSIDYINEKPTYDYILESKIYYETIDSIPDIYNYTGGNMEYLIDDSLADDQVKIEVVYYDDLVNFELSYNDDDIIINGYVKGSQIKKIIGYVIDDLKDDKIYNYSKIAEVNVIIYSNSNTRVNIEDN
ncbi:MAG: DUF1700 domain-containing protein [Bacilli bacterium]|nr:DUF1700 domain-containing protein [Bacilli bacterium]